MSLHKVIEVTQTFLDNNPNIYFVFGDNIIRRGYGGAAKLRDHPRAIGFITKKFPDNRDTSFYHVEEYEEVFFEELNKLTSLVKANPDNIYFVSQLGEGLANRYQIWENLIRDNLIKELKDYNNVVFCWNKSNL